jgi:O-succinylbenzoate synthase
VDAPVTSVAALAALAPAPAAVNVKPARMGGVLEAIACLELCHRRGLAANVGGMFEVGVGRQHSLALAALACPDGPNDIAPLLGEGPRTARLIVDANAPGLGGDPLP